VTDGPDHILADAQSHHGFIFLAKEVRFLSAVDDAFGEPGMAEWKRFVA